MRRKNSTTGSNDRPVRVGEACVSPMTPRTDRRSDAESGFPKLVASASKRPCSHCPFRHQSELSYWYAASEHDNCP